MRNCKAIFLMVAALGSSPALFAQGTAFTYQGQLQNNGGPANGQYDFTFALFNAAGGGAQIGSTVTNLGLGVTNGFFIANLNFGAVFTGESAWLAIGVRSNATGSFAPLTPLQQVTPTPYAIYAGSANATNLVGTVQTGSLSGVALLNGGNALTGQQTVAGGNVGIGTTAPGSQLTVSNGADPAITLIGSGGNGKIDLGIASFATAYSTSAHANDAVIRQSGLGNLYLQTGTGAAAMAITSNNNVGIRTASPDGPLTVATSNGSVTIANGQYTAEMIASSSSAPGHMRFRNGFEVWPDTNSANAGYLDVRNTNGTAVIELDGATSAIHAPGAGVNTGTFAFIQRAVGTNTTFDQTVIDNPVCNGDPNAILIVTHNYNADTNSTSQYNTAPVGVFYTGAHWEIYNEDGSAMALGRAFNVMVIKN